MNRSISFALMTVLVLPAASLHAEATSAAAPTPVNASAPAPVAVTAAPPESVPAPVPVAVKPAAAAVANPVPVAAPEPLAVKAAPPASAPVQAQAPAAAPEAEPVSDPVPAAVTTPAPGPDPAEQVGKWTFSMNDPGPDLKKISAARQKKLRSNLQEIARIITSTPVMSPPKGFEARFWGSLAGKDRYDICSGKKCPPTRPTASLSMMIGRYVDKGGKFKGAFNTPSTMDISTNSIGSIFSHLPVLHKDADGFMLPEPAAAGERAGMPTYLNKGHVIAVLAKNSQPLWLPVSRERFLKAEIAAVSKELGLPLAPPVEETKKKKKKKNEKPAEAVQESRRPSRPVMVDEGRSWIDPAAEQERIEKSRTLTPKVKESEEELKERLQKLQAELDGLAPEQRTIQARVDIKTEIDDEVASLLPIDSSAGVAVVTPNFNYFNPKLSPEAIQLVTFQWKFDGYTVYDPQSSNITDTLNNRALLEIYKTMNWNRLKGLK